MSYVFKNNTDIYTFINETHRNERSIKLYEETYDFNESLPFISKEELIIKLEQIHLDSIGIHGYQNQIIDIVIPALNQIKEDIKYKIITDASWCRYVWRIFHNDTSNFDGEYIKFRRFYACLDISNKGLKYDLSIEEKISIINKKCKVMFIQLDN